MNNASIRFVCPSFALCAICLDEWGKDTDEDYLGFLRGFWQNVGGDIVAVPSCHCDTPIKYSI